MVEQKWVGVLTTLLEAKRQEVLAEFEIEVTREELVGWLIVDISTEHNAGGLFFIRHLASHWDVDLDLSEFTEEELGNGVTIEEMVGIIRRASQVPVIS